MQSLTIDQLHQLRLSIFDNAEALYKESELLFDNEMYARAYLLSYFACEELGKIPIIVGVLGKLTEGKEVDWKKVEKRYRNHNEKVISENYHHYLFGLEIDLIRDTDIKWLEEQNETSKLQVINKNNSTYVDVADGQFKSPHEQISEEGAKLMKEYAFSCLKAHWYSESLSNPILVALKK